MDFEQSVKVDMEGMIQQTLGVPLGPGEMGAVLARAGVGKTACLTYIALEQLLQGYPVLHVCIEETPDNIKVWYQELLKNIAVSQSLGREDLERLQIRVEVHRFILAYLYRTFSPGKLEQSFGNLKNQADFHPSLVVLDGLDFDGISRSVIEEIQGFVRRHDISMWISARTHRHIDTTNQRGIPYPCHEIDDLFHTVLFLDPMANVIRLKALKLNDRYQTQHLTLSLDPRTLLLRKE
jgi:hypothetical protein